MTDELIRDRMRHLDNEIAASEARVRRAWDAMRTRLNEGQTADWAHGAVSAQHGLTADEKGRLSSYYYKWRDR